MIKYLVGLLAAVVLVGGYFLLMPASPPPAPPEPVAAPAPEPAADLPAAAEPEAAAPTPEELLEQIAAATREDLPMAVSDTLTLADAIFLPRMGIMEHVFVAHAGDLGAAAADLRQRTQGEVAVICRDRHEIFERSATLRHTLRDSAGNLRDRVYVLPEDCGRPR